MYDGWIKVHRQILENPMWTEEPFSRGQAWIDLLLLANHQDGKKMINGEFMTLRRGQHHTSILKLCDRWHWSNKKTKRFLSVLEKEGMITFESTKGGTTNGTTITIVKYDDYQGWGTTEEQTKAQRKHNGVTNGSTTEALRKHINNNDKNEKNENNEKNEKNNKEFFPNDEELNQTFIDYINMRKQIKKPMSGKAITLAMNKLESLSGGDNEKAIKILNQSIFNSWQGLFELKEPKQKEQSSFFEALNKCT